MYVLFAMCMNTCTNTADTVLIVPWQKLLTVHLRS